MSIKLRPETRQRLISSIKRYFEEDMEQEIGDLKAGLLLEFFLKELGPSVYNTAIGDAQAHLQERVGDLDGTCYEPEFCYWKR
ncbi:MAG: DUF2164 domain-containing protein [Vicinamibacterales bacterium]|jgi:uncharacterized protein (DUF2164 family)|nr:DUF2164 domain-containing protein [Vicinamibacterales bacterium]